MSGPALNCLFEVFSEKKKKVELFQRGGRAPGEGKKYILGADKNQIFFSEKFLISYSPRLTRGSELKPTSSGGPNWRHI